MFFGPNVNSAADFSQIMDGYLLSDDFVHLCDALGFSNIECSMIKSDIASSIEIFDEETAVANGIFFKLTTHDKQYSKELRDESYLIKRIDDFYFEAYIWSESDWNVIKSKLIRDIKSGKINSMYFLDKAFYDVLHSIEAFTDSYLSEDHIKTTSYHYILLAEIDYFLRDKSYSENKVNFITKMLISLFRNNPLYFDSVEEKFIELSKIDEVPENVFDEYLHFMPNYNSHDLSEIICVKPISKEFIDLLASLKLDLFRKDEIRNDIENGQSVLKAIYNAFEDDNNVSDYPDDKGSLNSLVRGYYYKSILYLVENEWFEIKKALEEKIESEEIKSRLDLKREFENMASVDDELKMNADLLYAQIDFALDFLELKKNVYFKDLAYMARHESFADCNIIKYIRQLDEDKDNTIKQKTYLDDDKFPAPKWLAFPELPYYSKYWIFWDKAAFYNSISDNVSLFSKPKKFDILKEHENEKLPFRLMKWRDGGKPKYSRLDEDYEIVNRFITLDQFDNPIVFEGIEFYTIKQAMVACKVIHFNKFLFTNDRINTALKYDYDDEENRLWQEFKYTVCLNATFLKFMSDRHLREKLIETGDKALVYISDDEYGCDKNIEGENLFGFALMEVRDEIKRLFANEDKIDWGYTKYLMNRRVFNPIHDENDGDHISFERTYRNLQAYVLDKDMSRDPYEIGEIINENELRKATDVISDLNATHRLMILSNHLGYSTSFKEWGDVGEYVGSYFKVLDKYTVDGKTQILFLHLHEFERGYFKTDYEYDKQLIELSRKTFEKILNGGM